MKEVQIIEELVAVLETEKKCYQSLGFPKEEVIEGICKG